MATTTVQKKKDVKRNKKPAKLLADSAEKNNIEPEEFEEDRSVNIRMKKQPFSQQPNKVQAKKNDKA